MIPAMNLIPISPSLSIIFSPIYYGVKGLVSALLTLSSLILTYPIYYAAFCAYFLLNLLLSPFVYLGLWVFWLVSLPFRILISFKALVIYLGVASLTGAGLGLLLYFLTTSTLDLLLNRFTRFSAAPRRKTWSEHRAIEGAKYTPPSDSDLSNNIWADWGWGLDASPLMKRGLLSETILEEESQESEFEPRS
ncbi:hypothetical protein BDW59DRAFT_143423 [Aspergillus cavernicola]|uniref:Uncharacterized protein n=1 Tax=Aspergillus cavernicola TaxID=176166 RepID=A0ABR4IKE4_9EURO